MSGSRQRIGHLMERRHVVEPLEDHDAALAQREVRLRADIGEDADRRLRNAEPEVVRVDRVGIEHLAGPCGRVAAATLQHHPDPGEQLAAAGVGIEAEHPHAAALGAPVALAGLQGGGLPGAVGAQDGGDAAPGDLQRQPVDRHGVPVGHPEVVDHDRRVRRTAHPQSLGTRGGPGAG